MSGRRGRIYDPGKTVCGVHTPAFVRLFTASLLPRAMGLREYSSSSQTDPRGPTSGLGRVFRGSGWHGLRVQLPGGVPPQLPPVDRAHRLWVRLRFPPRSALSRRAGRGGARWSDALAGVLVAFAAGCRLKVTKLPACGGFLKRNAPQICQRICPKARFGRILLHPLHPLARDEQTWHNFSSQCLQAIWRAYNDLLP